MGFDVSYTTTERISPTLQREIIDQCQSLYSAYSWVNVTGPSLDNEDGYLAGSSRLSPDVDADDAADARDSGHPDGRLKELIDCLCRLSAKCDIEWEIEHDHSGGPFGYIRGGNADADVRDTIDGLDAMFDEMDGDFGLPDSF